ncbi:hypothetical protein SteCoe_13893 [Stentor coeruleus]|uniref:Uncharacterized protein n=1 Tax=Stentor coeruleus TaxID=5963 RepID=A0A1R2C7B5_9CILI|nr:hypothetical protein SteCoe_13893 [Stentor coeruleus]
MRGEKNESSLVLNKFISTGLVIQVILGTTGAGHTLLIAIMQSYQLSLGDNFLLSASEISLEKTSIYEFFYILAFNLSFIILPTIGYYGFASSKVLAIATYTIFTIFGSSCTFLYYVMKIFDNCLYNQAYLIIPIYGILLGTFILCLLHSELLETDEICEIPINDPIS